MKPVEKVVQLNQLKMLLPCRTQKKPNQPETVDLNKT